MPPALVFYILKSLLLFAANGYLVTNPPEKHILRTKCDIADDGQPAEPLFLTPYIESGLVKEAKDLARVNFPGLPGLESYSGFITVNKTYNSNQFFWYFPAKRHHEESVVILWLQGGPGGSSLFGLFAENGPIEVKNGAFKMRKTHWAIDHHLIYIDNPVGSGFSFTNDSRGYCTDQTQIGEQLYSTLIQFFQLFPELQSFKFIISGESYAGKYIPALAYTIHHKNPSATLKINLKGLAIGDGWCDPINQMAYSNFLLQIGLIDFRQLQEIEKLQNKSIELIQKKQWESAYESNFHLFWTIGNYVGDISVYNFLINQDHDEYVPLLCNATIRKAIHVGELGFEDFSRITYDYLTEDMMKSVAPWISELLNHYPVLIYNGQLDIIVAYTLTVDFLRNLKFSSSEEYKKAEREFLKWQNEETGELELIGYRKRAGNLTEVMIRNAGHMVPSDQPEWALAMLKSWLSSIEQ